MTSLSRTLAIAAAALLSIGATKPAPPAAKANWLITVSTTPTGGHIVGNPDGGVRLVEYVSYTCSHCAEFDVEAKGELAVGLVKPGKGSIEYRPFFRNIIDVTSTLLVNCGPPTKFQGNHSVVLSAQKKWLVDPSEAQQKRWTTGDFGTRMRAIAGDMKLYPLFEARGYRRVELDRCLADKALAQQIADENKNASEVIGITGTPSFLLNGTLQHVHGWAELRPLLMAVTR